MPPIKSIQYLRGLAAAMVVLFHVDSFRTGVVGSAGVDIFFVISGFIMWAVISRRDVSPAEFLYNRIVRIVPLYWFYTLVLAAAAAVAPSAFAHLKLSMKHLLLSLLFIPHYDTSNGLITPLLVQGWTLDYEMFFYAIVALSLFFGAAKRLAIVVGAIFGLLIFGLFVPHGAIIRGFYTNPLLLEFLAGIGVFHLWRNGRLPGARGAAALIGAATIGFLASAPLGMEAQNMRVLVWGVPATLLVLGAVSLEKAKEGVNLPLAGLLGDASFSIYMTHSFMISVLHKLFGHGAQGGVEWPAYFSAGAFIGCLLAGLAAYWLLERPLLDYSRRLYRAIAPHIGAPRAAAM